MLKLLVLGQSLAEVQVAPLIPLMFVKGSGATGAALAAQHDLLLNFFSKSRVRVVRIVRTRCTHLQSLEAPNIAHRP